jgi:uncharacterized caspase-like protein
MATALLARCRRPTALVLLAAALAACTTVQRNGAPARVALVIGNAAYENAPALNNPTHDARDMCAALQRQGFKTLCHVNVRDRAAFEQHVDEYLAQLGKNSVGVFYYSGHGVQAGNANFLIPTQVQLRSVAENPLRVLYGVDELFDRMRHQPTYLQFVILDACRTDLFGQPPRTGNGSSATPGRSVLMRALESTSRARIGLAPIKDAPVDTLVLYATGSREAAYDGDGRNGPLTKHVLQHIATHGLSLDQFLKRVTAGVATETQRTYGARQTPFIYGSFSGDFCFAGCPGTFPPPPTL